MLFGHERDYNRRTAPARPTLRRVQREKEQGDHGQLGETAHNSHVWRNMFRSVTTVVDEEEEDTPCGCMVRAWADEDSVLRRLVSVVILTFYAFTGAGIFYGIEKSANAHFGARTNDTNAQCAYDFWSCLYYANTLYTTIGYGSIAPCTTGGQVFTMLYTIGGIPVMVLTVSNTGFLMAKWSGIAWRRLRNAMRSWWQSRPIRIAVVAPLPPEKIDPEKPPLPADEPPPSNDMTHVVAIAAKVNPQHHDEVEKKKHEQRGLLPFPLAIMMCLAFILISSLYFYLCERFTTYGQRWTYFESLYFFVISVITLGLGDYDASRENRSRTSLDFVFIVIGISLFSMCVNIIQYDLEHLSVTIGQSIMEDYQKSLSEGHALGSMAAQAAAVSSDVSRSEHERRQAEVASRAFIRQLIHKKGGWMTRIFVGTNFEDRLLEGYQKLSHMRLASTQTELEQDDVATMTDSFGGGVTVGTSTRDFGGVRMEPELHQFPDLRSRERIAIKGHVKRIFTGHFRRREERELRFRALSQPDVSQIE